MRACSLYNIDHVCICIRSFPKKTCRVTQSARRSAAIDPTGAAPKNARELANHNTAAGNLVPRTRSSHHNCRESGCELRVQRGTRIIELLVPFDSEVRKRVCPQNDANFGIGALVLHTASLACTGFRRLLSGCRDPVASHSIEIVGRPDRVRFRRSKRRHGVLAYACRPLAFRCTEYGRRSPVNATSACPNGCPIRFPIPSPIRLPSGLRRERDGEPTGAAAPRSWR